ncbi:jerky protein homolog-like [Homalodisca vitripennis]|uniref:jerky protein homolog-like n=1 Tax=Homalodisca vitripennis TaxID=197043 RepID=UPI001EEA3C45|nr:jerky protein homolog-like [Homalodisca vitripennis]
MSADSNAAAEYLQEFKEITPSYSPQQVYNADETGLNFKALPTKSLASREEKSAPGFKMDMQRLTVLACSNASATNKIPLMVIGKSKKPRCFKNMNMNALPVYYKNQKKAWMDRALFQEWFEKQFVPNVRAYNEENGLPDRALLLIDNAPSHPDDLELVAEAWENTSVGALQKSWKNLWPDLQFVEEVVPPVNECELLPLVKKIPGCENVEKECVDEWTAVDDKGFEEYTDEDIVAQVQGVPADDSCSSEDEGDAQTTDIVPHSAAASAFDLALRYVEQHAAATPNDVENDYNSEDLIKIVTEILDLPSKSDEDPKTDPVELASESDIDPTTNFVQLPSECDFEQKGISCFSRKSQRQIKVNLIGIL